MASPVQGDLGLLDFDGMRRLPSALAGDRRAGGCSWAW
jgi:hypothetical protein